MWSRRLFQGLRFKITIGVTLPLLILLSLFSYLQYVRQRDALLANLDRTTTNLSNVIVGSLEHAMLSRDIGDIQVIMDNIASQGGVRDVFLMNSHDEVRFAPGQRNVGKVYARTDPGCVECHGPQVTQHTSSVIYTNDQNERVFRNCKEIVNAPECQACHKPQDTLNGVLVTDVSMQGIDETLASTLKTQILWSAIAIAATILVVNALMSSVVVTKIERLAQAIKHFSLGDMSRRVRVQSSDEIGELAGSFNQMMQALEERTQELERLNEELRRKENLRGVLLVKLTHAQEEERKRVARELHDQLGQALSAMTMGMEAAENALPPQLSGLKERLLHAKEMATQALEQTHELILNLRPVDLDDLGLISAIRSNAENHLTPRGIQVQVTVQGTQRRLPPELEITLFRIVQEAINNIANHASAQHADLRIKFLENEVEVVVQDDGRGFDVTTVVEGYDQERGFGLLGMQERAELAEGSFQIDSQPGRGTRIVITMPVQG